MTGLIRVHEEGWTGFSQGWQACYEGFQFIAIFKLDMAVMATVPVLTSGT